MSCNTSEGMFLSEGTCHSNDVLVGKCLSFTIDGVCAMCRQGYYKDGHVCVECLDTCQTCSDGTSCVKCNDAHFMVSGGTCKPKSDAHGCAVDIDSDVGCTKCKDGYFLQSGECFACSVSFESCLKCTERLCTVCPDGSVMLNDTCFPASVIEHCTEASMSKCTSCSFWRQPSHDGTKCIKHAVWWVITIAILVVVVFITIALVVAACIAFRVARRVVNSTREKTCVFKMSRSNVVFVSTKLKGIVANKTSLYFDHQQLPIDCESMELICIGNTSKRKIKIQFVSKDEEKFIVKTTPGAVTLRKGFACEFCVSIIPLCSTVIDDDIQLVVDDITTNKTSRVKIEITAATELTAKLYYDDITMDRQIGEGSFGVVFKGVFRGDDVAVKMLKGVDVSEEAMDEFTKEVEMLDKFRCNFIVHFYGACFIPNHNMMVKEFAPCGSLMDCITKKNEPSYNIKTKLMLDAARGIEYLHNNGILHRDIKPDNVLVFSLDENITANGKLTDFGSSRNVNMLLTNMTFTKGIGTPAYMAPEILNKERYKKAADVYSFGVMMYECFAWRQAFPQTRFKYPWDIVSFVTGGKRPERPDNISAKTYDIIGDCWRDDSKQRIGHL